ncbi:MAG: hypothetical protein RLZZ488_2060, partial [Pseudomonadota bacterium]
MRQIRVLLLAGLLGLTVFSGCEESRVSSIVPQTSATLSDLDYDSIGNHSVWTIQDQLRKIDAPSDRVDAISRAALAEVRYAKPVEGPLQLRLNVDEIGAEGIDAALALRAAVRGAMRAVSEIKADLSSEEQKKYTLALSNSGLIVSKSASEKSVTIPIALLAQASMTEIGRNLSASGISNVAITDVMKEIAGESVTYLGGMNVSGEQLVDAVAAIAAGLSSGAATEGTANQVAKSVAVAVAEKLSSVGLNSAQLTTAIKEISDRIVQGLSQTSLSASVLTDTKSGLSEGIISGLGSTVTQAEKDTLAQTVQQVFTDTGASSVKVLTEEPSVREVTLFGGVADRTLSINFSDVLSQSNFSAEDAPRTRFLVSGIYSGELRKGDVKLFQGALWVPGERIEWTPPLSAKEGQRAFKLTALLGDTLTQRTVNVTVYLQGANEAPKLANFNPIAGGNEDVPMVITHEALRAASDLSDSDSAQVFFRIISFENGTTLKGGQPVQLGELLGPGEFFVWIPAANSNGTLSPFKVVAYDGELESAAPVPVRVTVSPVNDAPTVVAAVSVADGLEDSPTNFSNGRLKEITLAGDVDLNLLTFKVTGINQGTLSRAGGAFVNVGDIIPSTETLTWLPPLNSTGVLNPIPAFRVAAYDGSLFSALETQISVQVNPVNDAPVLTTIQPFENAVEGRPFFITYESLLAKSDLRDVDTASMMFRLVSVSGSSGEAVYEKGSTTPLTAGAILRPGDVWEWTPPIRYYSRPLQGFKVEGWDGALPSERQIDVNFSIVAENHPPEFKAADLHNAGPVPVRAGEEVTITYAQVEAALELYDPENVEPPAQFRKGKPIIVLDKVPNQGVLRKGGVVAQAQGVTLEPNETWQWTAPNDVLGVVEALVLRARDADGSASESAATFRFLVQVQPNRAPTLSTINTLQNAREEDDYTLRYEQLLSASDAADLDNNTLVFRIRGLLSGQLKKGETILQESMLSGDGVLIGPNDVLTWTPVLNDFNPERAGFTVSVFDGSLDSAVVDGVTDTNRFIPVKFNVAPRNDAPVLTGFSKISATTAGVSFKEDTPATLTFSQLYFAAGKSDVDDTFAVEVDANPTFKHVFVVETVADDSQLLVNGVLAVQGTVINKDSVIVWQPPLNASGDQQAFTLRLKDENPQGPLASASALPVTLNLLPDNDAPVVTLPQGGLTAQDVITGAEEDIPFVLTYEALVQKMKPYVSDVDGPKMVFLVSPVADQTGNAPVGTLSKQATVIGLGSAQVVEPGDALTWQPPLHTDGVISAFSVKAFDGTLASNVAAVLQVDVQPINHAPTIVTSKTLSAAKNVTRELTHRLLADELGYTDLENLRDASCDNSPKATFRILDIPSGKVYKKVGAAAPVQVFVGADFSPCDVFQWEPPKDVYSTTLQGVRIRAFDDKSMPSPATAMLSFEISGANEAPKFVSATPQVLGNAKQDLTRQISYDELKAATGASDAEGATLRFFVSAGLPTPVVQGSDTVSIPSTLFKGTAEITAETEVGPGETLLWNPPAKVFGAAISAFTVKVFDGEKFSEDDPNTAGNEAVVTLKVNVDRVNRVPVINTTPVLAGVNGDRASEDVFYEITIEKLLAATNASDPDLNDTIRFKLSQTIPLQGTLQFEQSTNNWVAVTPANGDILGADFAAKWRWKGPALAHGAIQAFGIQPFDGDAATGLNPVATPVTVKVDSVNNLPVLGKGLPAAIDEFSGAIEDEIFAINYESLFAASYASGVQPDLDGDAVKFRFKGAAARSGVLFKNGMSTAVVDGDLLAPGETWHWQAPQNENRVTNNNLPHIAFTVAAFDGTAESSNTLPVRVRVTEINDIPTVGTVLMLDPPAEKNQAGGYPITYAMVKAAVPVSDVETSNLDDIEYRIESVGAGTLRLGQFNSGSVVTTAMPMLKSTGGDLNTSASALNWTPPLNSFGQTFLVMTVRPFDGTDYGAESYEVKIDVTGSNAVPTLNSGFTLGSSSNRAEGSSQNTPIVISYETLLARGNVQDTDLSTVFLQITSVETGKVVLGGVEFPVGTYPEGNAQNTLRLGPGEKLTWYPAAEARGEDGAALSAFRFKA